ncbi:MAG TPA: M14 family metallopeptidase, partial [Candidatus Krumholzibacteria bacterium]|nr:M14 family metallopeptidase [Candidatus Krumholzibacteria bacterium]
YLKRLEQASRWLRLTSYGKSGQGRDLPLVIVSKERAFTPEGARASGKPIVFVQNGIHSGEIEGKDASLALLRDIAVLHTRANLLDHVTLLVLPIFSVDAHERRSPTNRINQNGPEEMGFRTTPIGLNLNRDYMKAEAPEMRAMLGQVFTRWWPHLLVDDHTTDGADYQYDLTWAYAYGAGMPPSLERWLTEAFVGRVVPRLEAGGHLVSPYISFRGDADDPRAGIEVENAPPRFSTAYAPLQCRPAILVETHMLKPYPTRVRATYDLLAAVLEEINARPQALLAAVAAAESLAVARGRETNPGRRSVVLSTKVTEHSEPFQYRGFVTRWEASDIVGRKVPRYTTVPWDSIIPIFREVAPKLTVTQPVGYLVPQEWTAARDLLEMHGVRYRSLTRAWQDTVEVQRLVAWSFEAALREGHHPTLVSEVALERRLGRFRAGDLWVPLDQPSALIAVHLFEAQAPDGMMFWNYFDTVLERKEYAETYVMEPLARKMLQADSALAREFRRRLASDSTFAASPSARNDFFYRRSRWADPEYALHPVVRALRRPPEAVLGKESRKQ